MFEEEKNKHYRYHSTRVPLTSCLQNISKNLYKRPQLTKLTIYQIRSENAVAATVPSFSKISQSRKGDSGQGPYHSGQEAKDA